MRHTVDALVIGGGPAGSLAALGLARLGWRTVLIERGLPHRGKCCGHCLNPSAEEVLRAHDLWRSTCRLATGRTERVRVHHWSQGSLEVPQPGCGRPGLVVRRRDFDAHLRDAASAAGVVVLQPALAGHPRTTPAGACVPVQRDGRWTSLHARLVVGADGLRSRVARWLAPSRTARRGRCYGFSFDLARPPRGCAETGIDMFLAPQGYLGLAHEPSRVHVAALVREGNEPRDPLSFARRMGAIFPEGPLAEMDLARLERTWMHDLEVSGPMPWQPVRVAGPRGALVGDAAGYVEPFTGEGMSWALRSAAILIAACATEPPGQWGPDTARRYQRLHRRLIRRRQRLCTWLSHSLRRPRVCTGLFWLATRRRWLLEGLVARVGS